MVDHSRQAVVGAIGGTFISLAIMDIDELTVSNFALLNSRDFKDPMEALGRYLKSVPRIPNKIGLSIAGVVDGEKATMNHLTWSFGWNDIRAVSGCDHVTFVNEFEALALAAPRMTDYDLIEINRGVSMRDGTRVVVSAGTGLGAAALVRTGDKWHAMSGESRYASFPAPLGHEFDIRSVIAHEGFVTAGQVLTGRGLVALYTALAKATGDEVANLSPVQITKAGLSGEDAAASKSLDLMATWLGRFAGDVALHFGATGGVFLAGGLSSGIVPALQTGRFRDAFEGFGERHEYLGTIPVNVIKAGADAGLRGAAIALADSLPVRPTKIRQLQA
ncbi:MAG: glucokinase [Devosia sp.]